MLSNETIGRILQLYGLGAFQSVEVQKGYRNEVYSIRLETGDMVNLILYKREPGILQKIKNANRVGEFLSEQNFPARRPIDSRLVSLRSAGTTAYAGLYNYLPGKTIPWEAYTMKHIKQIGKTLGMVHTALSSLPRSGSPSAAAETLSAYESMKGYFAQAGVQSALRTKLDLKPPTLIEQYQKVLHRIDTLPNQQPLHMDFVRGNILFDGDSAEVTGILDFEKTGWGHPALDIARTLAFLIVDCKYKPEMKIRKYFLDSGYAKRGGGSLPSPQLLEAATKVFLLYDFYKFLLHNPYEFLCQNEHFVRTRDILIERKVLSRIG